MSRVPLTRRVLLILAASAVFLVSWVLRYNVPEGSFGGLSDDHMFYAVQGWQLLFGELPDRDFNDPGAPLTYALSAALQVVLGRSVWSEFVFCVLALSAGAALTCVLAARATGSIGLGLLAGIFEIAMRPRLYNYPKMILYAAGIALIWGWIAAPRARRTWLVAAMAAFAFLMRHDHGLYIGFAFAVAILAATHVPWRDKARHALLFAAAMLLFLGPYLVYLQGNGGIVRHFEAGARYSARDYERAPLVLPTPEWRPLTATLEFADETEHWWEAPPFAALDEYHYTWWLYWLFVSLPLVSLGLLAVHRTPPPAWPYERAGVIALAVLALVLDWRLLRGNLTGRLADVAVPMALLGAWSAMAIGRWTWARRSLVAVATAAVAIIVAAVTGAVLTRTTGEQLRASRVIDGFEATMRESRLATRFLERTWPMELWTDETTGQIGLARYLAACTAPEDRVLIAPFIVPVYGLAQRGFAGGRLDLRGGFYDSPEEQRITVERLQRQSVPIVIGPPSSGAATFAKEFPPVAAWLAREYRSAGDMDLGGA